MSDREIFDKRFSPLTDESLLIAFVGKRDRTEIQRLVGIISDHLAKSLQGTEPDHPLLDEFVQIDLRFKSSNLHFDLPELARHAALEVLFKRGILDKDFLLKVLHTKAHGNGVKKIFVGVAVGLALLGCFGAGAWWERHQSTPPSALMLHNQP